MLMQEFQAQLAEMQEFPWTVAAGADEANMRLVGKLPPKESTPAETFLKWYTPPLSVMISPTR